MSPNGRKRQKPEKMEETIHSGQFMVSDIDDSEVQDGEDSPSLVVHESDCDQESSPIPAQAFDFETACKETSKTYTFGPRSSLSISIDVSLTKLFECMTLAYSGKLTSPRWKQFKGLKLRLKEKIRLNNMIWRAWHMQFVMRMKTFVCQFATPLDGEMHMKPEAVVIEGTYWKRRMANITAEYKKWRLFAKDYYKFKPISDSENMAVDFDSRWSQRSMDSFPGSFDDDFIMDFSDTLFSTLNPSQPFDFPNPREIASRVTIADFIQPGLVQLQPSVDDFMDTLEPLPDFLTSKLPTLPEEMSDNQLAELSSPPIQEAYYTTPAASAGLYSSPIFASTKRMNELKRKTMLPQKPQQSSKMGVSDKLMSNNFLNISSNNNILVQNNATPSTAQVGQNLSLQIDNVSSDVSIIAPSEIRSPEVDASTDLANQLHQCGSSKSMFVSGEVMNANSGQQHVQVLKDQVSSQTTLQPEHLSVGMVNQKTLSVMPKQPHLFQAVQPVQVPLTTFSSQPPLNHMATQSSSGHLKTQNVPLFLTVDMVQQNPVVKSVDNNSRTIDGSMQIHNVFQSASLPLVAQQSQNVDLVKKEPNDLLGGFKGAAKSTEAQVFRRHSYATGQQVQQPLQHTFEPVSSRRSRRIAPAVTTSSASLGTFVVPEIPTRHRTRSRSVSSPQGGSPKPFAQQPSQAVSLTDISASLSSQLPTNRSERAVTPDITQLNSKDSQNAAEQVTNILPQNALLAQLLSGRTQQCDFSSSNSKSATNAAIPSSNSPVTLIESFPTLVSSSSQTFVFSSIPLSTVAGVSDFQRSLLVGAANQAFGGQTASCVPVVQGASSMSNEHVSPSCSPSAATASGSSFDANNLLPKTARLKSDEERNQHKEHRRVCHINAEQKRRCNIKNGFEALHHLLPPLNQNPNSKVSKAALLQRGAEYIRTLKAERQQQQEEAEHLKKQIEALNQAISHYQSQLPASGVPVPCQKTNRMKEMFEEYVRQQTLKNWKFWIFSLILEPLVESYNSNVSTANIDEMCKSILAWLDQHCSLVALRPGVLNSLRHLSTSTNILTDPSCIAEEATRAVTKKELRNQ